MPLRHSLIININNLFIAAVLKCWKNEPPPPPPLPLPPSIPLNAIPPVLPPVPMDDQDIHPEPSEDVDVDDKQPVEDKSHSESDTSDADSSDASSSDEEIDEAVLATTLQTELVQLLLATASKSEASSIKTQPVFKNVTKKKDVGKSPSFYLFLLPYTDLIIFFSSNCVLPVS